MKVKVKKSKEILDNTPCPCGSGKVYGECCKKKKFKYEIDGDEYIKKVNMSDELFESIKEAENQFEEYYNRKPDKNDFLTSFAPSFNDEVLLQIIYAMRESGMPEEKIYAYYKTNGLLATNSNIDYIPDEELKEFNDFCNEYLELMRESSNESMNSVKFVMLSNSFLCDEIDYIFNALIATCNDFIRRHINPNDALTFATKDPLDFCVFSALKTVKTLQSIEKLQKNHLPECIYSLGRSFFENYMYMCAINSDLDFFNKKLLPIIDDEKYNFVVEPNGKISQKKLLKNHQEKKLILRL